MNKMTENALIHANSVRQALESAKGHVAGVENEASDTTERINEGLSRLDHVINQLEIAQKQEPEPLTVDRCINFLQKEATRLEAESVGEDYGELTTHLFSLANRLLKEVRQILRREDS